MPRSCSVDIRYLPSRNVGRSGIMGIYMKLYLYSVMCLLYQWIGFQIEDSPMLFCEYMISYILLNDKYV